MIAEIGQNKKIIRYKIVDVGGNYYIQDMDRNNWLFFFPFLFWFLSYNIYQTDLDTVDHFLPKKQNKKAGLTVIGIGTSSYLVGSSIPLDWVDIFKIEISIFTSIVILAITITLVVSLRFKITHFYYKRMTYSQVNKRMSIYLFHVSSVSESNRKSPAS